MTTEFEQIVHRNDQMLRGYSMSLTANRDDAQDLYQDTLLKAFRGLHTFRQGTNESGWLYTIMRNTFINGYRSKRNNESPVDPGDMDHLCKATEPLAKMEWNGFHDELHTAFYALPRVQQEVLYLREFEDLNYEAIALRVRVPVGTVRSRLNRGRALLGKKLRRYAAGLGYPTHEPALRVQEQLAS
ncbi:MAG: sigma-70 family RNA polymerase sigma factor [Ignavibacteria bacterium]|nr:sigma-70 family RNA polymerase sigma factor [Ignavibacteria bacterium]